MQYAIAYDNIHFIRLKMELLQLNPLNFNWLLKLTHFFHYIADESRFE